MTGESLYVFHINLIPSTSGSQSAVRGSQAIHEHISVMATLNFYCFNYRGADKSLARPTSRCILFDGENISFGASLVLYIYIYRVSQEECEILRESVPYVKLYRYNPKHLHPKLNGYGVNGHRKVWVAVVSTNCTPSVTQYSSCSDLDERFLTR